MFVLLCVTFNHVKGQNSLNEYEAKAVYIKHFLSDIEWPRHAVQGKFTIAVLSKDSVLYSVLTRYAQMFKYGNRTVEIIYLPDDDAGFNCNMLIVEGSYNRSARRYIAVAEKKNILLVGTNDSPPYCMINFVYANDKLQYQIDKDWLESRGFKLGEKVLIYGGSPTVFNELYSRKKDEIDQLLVKLEKKNAELSRFEEVIKQKEQTLVLLKTQSDSINDDLSAKERMMDSLSSVLYDKTALLKLNERKVDSAFVAMKKQKSQLELNKVKISSSRILLDSLYETVKQNRQRIQNQESVLVEKDKEVRTKERYALWLLGSALLFLVGVLLSLFVLRAKWKLALALSREVDERSAELKVVNMRFYNLFENSPVALWEEDITAIRGYIKSMDLTVEEYCKLLSEHKEMFDQSMSLIKVIDVNHECVVMHGFDSKETLKKEWFRIFTMDAYETYAEGLAELLGGKTVFEAETSLLTCSGEIKNVIMRWNIAGKGGNERLLVSMIDITRQKRIEQELEKNKEMLEEKVKLRTEELEAANEELTATNDELYSKNVDLHDHQYEINQLNEELMQTNEELLVTNEAVEKQKEELEKMIGKLKSAQQQLVQSEKMASLGVLTAGVAHEINNPINYISSGLIGLKSTFGMLLEVFDEYKKLKTDNSETQLQKVEEVEEDVEIDFVLDSVPKMLSSIGVGVERTVQIVDSLRVFSRSSNEKFEFVNLHEGIKSTLTILYNKYKNRITVEKRFGDLPLVYCIGGKINQVFMNIIVNAVQAIDDTGKIFITTSYNKASNSVTVSIADDGKGISDEILTKIFDPFFTTKPVGEGTGLGLSISYSIILEHGGALSVKSEKGEGTEFTIVLPVNKEGGERVQMKAAIEN